MNEIVEQLIRISEYLSNLCAIQAMTMIALFGILIFKDCLGSSVKGIEEKLSNLISAVNRSKRNT